MWLEVGSFHVIWIAPSVSQIGHKEAQEQWREKKEADKKGWNFLQLECVSNLTKW